MTAARRKSKLAWALEHAALGIPVFPLHPLYKSGTCSCRRGAECDSPGKHPLVDGGFHVATTDREQIRSWWKRWPKANIGGRTGGEWLVVDVDPRNGGDESLAAFEAEHGALLRTAVVRTGQYDGGRGRHFWFRADGIDVGCRRPFAGIEIKADGGYVVLPGSTHFTGVPYEWEGTPRFEAVPSSLVGLATARLSAEEKTAQRGLTGLPLGRRTLDALDNGLPSEEGKTHREVAVGIARNLVESGAHRALVRLALTKILMHPNSALNPDYWNCPALTDTARLASASRERMVFVDAKNASRIPAGVPL